MASFRKRGKKWQYRIKTDDGELSKGGFDTKAEARVAASKVQHEIDIGVQVNKGDLLFYDYYKHWAETYKLGVYSKDTDNFYLNALKLIKQYFPHTKLKNITKDDYQSFLNDYADNNGHTRSKQTVRKTHIKISACLKNAQASGHIVHDPTYKVTIRGKEPKKESEKYLNESEAKAVLNELLNDIKFSYVTRYMLIFQLATGMRISEVMAIQFKNINFLAKTVNIDKSWDYKENHEFKSTKNKETRVITIDSKTLKIIKPFYDHQMSQKIADRHSRLFAKNGHVPSINAINKALVRACKRANAQVVTSHALRHTHASLLLLNGVSIAYVSKRLGHKTISITSDTYSHLLKELEAKSEKESADIFYNIYG